MLAAFSWILFGLIAGLIAKAILPGKILENLSARR
jgi:uncharacterized membrane protein YeaQ/YmgE (transglycosylase-associated protein family)